MELSPHHLGKASQGEKVLDKCSGIAKDEGASDSLVVENDNDPRDALAQLADKIRLDQLQSIYCTETT